MGVGDMRWIAGRVIASLLWAFLIVLAPFKIVGALLKMLRRGVLRIGRVVRRFRNRVGFDTTNLASPADERSAEAPPDPKKKAASRHPFWILGALLRTLTRGVLRTDREIRRFREEVGSVATSLASFADEQSAEAPLDPKKETVFLLITCGQAVRNFLLSDVFALLKRRFNVVILSPYAYSDAFRAQYGQPGVHVLPWFQAFRSLFERVFQYYLMRKSRSRTHHSWLENLEARAKSETTERGRFLKHVMMRRMSDALGAVLGRRGLVALYQSYFLAYLPRSFFDGLFSRYEPALVISTTAHHAEAWPLTYFARRRGCATLANVLSWDNLTTKAAMDTSCGSYTVWSEEMKQELAFHFPYVNAQAFVTGAPLFDIYYNKPYAMDRAEFLEGLGLSPDLPYVLYTTNTPAGMPDENKIVSWFWEELSKSPLAGKVSLLVRLHPKEAADRYDALSGLENVALTLAGPPHWGNADRWLPGEQDMRLLLNSMMHAAVSVNVASTMSLESFALGLPTINVAFKATDEMKDHGLLWSFDMYHTSDHYRALVDNGAVDIVRSMDELLAQTVDALQHGNRRKEAMQRTLEQKAAYCNGGSAQRFFEVVESVVGAEPRRLAEAAQASVGSEAGQPQILTGARGAE